MRHIAAADAGDPDVCVDEEFPEAVNASSAPGVHLEDLAWRRGSINAQVADDDVHYGVHEVVCADSKTHVVGLQQFPCSRHHVRVCVVCSVHERREGDVEYVEYVEHIRSWRRCGAVSEGPDAAVEEPLC